MPHDPYFPTLVLPPDVSREELNAVTAKYPEVAGEREHFYLCEHCGQAVDRRRLGDVLYHEAADHQPLPVS